MNLLTVCRRLFLSTAVLAVGCGKEGGLFQDGPVSANSLVADSIEVRTVDPSSSPRGAVRRIRVLGSQFEPGAGVSFLRNGSPDTTITTDSVAYVSSGELLAFIRIAVTAPIGSRDVVVSALKGKKGIGSDLFDILSRIEVGDGVALGVNGRGEVVGWVPVIDPQPLNEGPPLTTRPGITATPQPFYWSASDGKQVLLPIRPPSPGEGAIGYGAAGYLMATAISEQGVIVGTIWDHPVRWTRVGGEWQIEDLAPGLRGVATDINEAGTIVGYGWERGTTLQGGDPQQSFERPFCWTPERGLYEPRKAFEFSGLIRYSRPLGDWTNWRLRVNGAGVAVGSAPAPPNRSRWENANIPIVFRCRDADPVITQLPIIGPYPWGQATAIAEDGTIYGILTDGHLSIPVKWSPLGEAWLPPQAVPGLTPGDVVQSTSMGGRLAGVHIVPLDLDEWIRVGFLSDETLRNQLTDGSGLALTRIWDIADRGRGTFFYAVGEARNRIPGWPKASLWFSVALDP